MKPGILLVSSDVLLRNALAHALRREGHLVFSAATRAEAETIVMSHGREIALAVVHGLDLPPDGALRAARNIVVASGAETSLENLRELVRKRLAGEA